MLSFQPGGADALDDVFLENEKYDHDRQKRQCGHSEHTAPVVQRFAVQEQLQREGYREFLRAVQIDERIDEVIPSPVKRENRAGDQGRSDERQDHPVEHAVFAAAVDFRRFVQLARNGADKLHDQKDEKRRAEEMRDDERLEGREPAELGEHDVLRYEDNVLGQHHRGHHGGEPELLAEKFRPRQPEGHESRRGDGPDRRQNDDDKRIFEKGRKRRAAESLEARDVVGEFQPARNEAVRGRENFVVRLQGAGRQPQDRIDHEQGEDADQYMVQDALGYGHGHGR